MSKKAIYFLSLMFYSINKLKSHMLFTSKMINLVKVWNKVFKDRPLKIYGNSFKIWTNWFVKNNIRSNFFKATFHKIYIVHSWLLCLIIKTKRQIFLWSHVYHYISWYSYGLIYTIRQLCNKVWLIHRKNDISNNITSNHQAQNT